MTAPTRPRPPMTRAQQQANRPPCPSFVGARVARITRLDSCGRPAYGDESVVTTKGMVTVTFEPEVEEGETSDTRNINGDICVPYRTPDTMTGVNVSIEFCQVDPSAFQIMNPTWKVVRNAQGLITGFRIGSSFSDQYGFALELWPKVVGNTGDACLSGDGEDEEQDPLYPWTQNGYFLLPYVIGQAPDEWEITGDEAATFTLNGMTKAPSPWRNGPYLITRDEFGMPSPLLQQIETGNGNGNFYYPQDPTRQNTDPDHFHGDIVYVSPPSPSCGAQPLRRPATDVSCNGNTVTLNVTNLDDQGDQQGIAPEDENGRRPAVKVLWGDGSPAEDIANPPNGGEVGTLEHTYENASEHRIIVEAPNGAYREILVDPGASLTMSPENPTIPPDGRQQLTVEQSPSDGDATDVTSQATWSSSNTDVATVGNNAQSIRGMVRAVSEGTTTITADYGCHTVSTEVTVAQPEITGITISGPGEVASGSTIDLQAMAQWSDGRDDTDVTSEATWSVQPNDGSIATVSGGTVTGEAEGEATITAEHSGQSAEHPVTVTAAQARATRKPNVTGDDPTNDPHTVALKLDNPPSGSISVDWGDGHTDSVRGAGPHRHTYQHNGTYTVVTKNSRGREITRDEITVPTS